MQKLKDFLANRKWGQLKKSDWTVIALAGVLILIIAIPTGERKTENISPAESGQEDGITTNNTLPDHSDGDDYLSNLEEKLKNVLSQMEGVGKVEVMITVSDSGESVVEKDISGSTTTTSETDSSGGTRTTTESSSEAAAVYVETGQETYPYVQKEKMPTIEGVMVVAEGGGNSVVASNISEAVKALFPVEAHRIKVVKMCSKEE